MGVRPIFLALLLVACAKEGPVKYRKLDAHTHFGPRSLPQLIAVMDANGIDTVVNLSGRSPGRGLEEQLAAAALHPGRIIVFTEPDWRQAMAGPGYGERMARDLVRAKELGARGLKISKGLGLGYVNHERKLLTVDDPGLDALFEKAGELGMPVAIHTGDPVAFWLPNDPQNERFDELGAHPEWSFYGAPVPSWDELYAAFERRVARHPKTTFIGVHFGNAPEYPERVSALLEKYPNLNIDTAARIPEIGRHDAEKMRKLFIRHSTRIVFGTDLGVGEKPLDLMLGSTGEKPPTQADVDHFFASTWRYLETRDKAFAHPTPVQGRWTIDGIGLPRDVLRKVYGENLERILGLK
jgi:predicted TIM-barrel fold metal-dependent hydrolase